MKKISLERRTSVCMKDVQAIQVSFASIFFESLYRTRTLSIAGDSIEFTNFTVFWTKFVPLEMKTFVNIENSVWTVITLYP